MKIILISNFDITNSEIQYDYDFSSFISIQFPVLTNDELKKLLIKNVIQAIMKKIDIMN
jgi:hypothetical protein